MAIVRKLLSLSDLYDFYVNHNENIKFSSKDEDKTIVVHITEPFVYEVERDDELNLYTNLKFCHLEENLNGSSISRKVMKEAMPTAYNMPILGYIWHDEESDTDKFAGHEFVIENDEIVYYEVPVGCIPESAGLKLVEEDNGKIYLEGKGIIWRTYSKAADILEREKSLSVSVELFIDELSYSAKDKVMVIEKFRFSGVTILQEDPVDGSEIKPGMAGADITIEGFSEKNNSIFSKANTLDNQLLIENSKKGGTTVDNFEENVKSTEKDGEATPSEDFEAKKKTEGEDDSDYDAPKHDDGEDKGGDDENQDTQSQNEQSDDQPEAENEDDSDDDNSEDEPESEQSVNSLVYTVRNSQAEFSVSLSEKLDALSQLVNNTYAEADCDYYSVDAYDDEKLVIMHAWCSGKIYRQQYSVKKDVYSLKGDRVEVFATYLTRDEQAQLDALKTNYSVLEDELNKFKSEPDKMSILSSEDYSAVKDTEEFAELMKQEAHFDLTVDEVRAKADAILLNAAKSHKVEFSAENKTGMKRFLITGKKRSGSRYGNLFNK